MGEESGLFWAVGKVRTFFGREARTFLRGTEHLLGLFWMVLDHEPLL